MKYVKFSPSTKSPTAMIEQSELTETSFTTNSGTFTSPPVAVSALATQRGVVAAKKLQLVTAQNLVIQRAGELNIENEILGNQLLQNAGYADGLAIASPNNAVSIVGQSGFPGKNAPVHHTTQAPAVENLSVTLGDSTGWADIHFDPITSVPIGHYKIYYTNVAGQPFNSGNWTLAGSTEISSATIKNLPVKVPLDFCVVAFNSNGEGDPSTIVSKELL